jgi:phage/plasmid primase-like uncharacterized protein
MFDLNDAGPQVVPAGLSERRKHSGPGPVTAILKLMSGRQNEILAALGITPSQRGHIRCPTPEHDDRNPSFRWDGEKFYCTCGSGDILDLIVRMGRAHEASSAARWAKEVLGVHVVKPAPSHQPALRRDPKFDVEFILSGCKPLAGTEGETYLAGRGLQDPRCNDLRRPSACRGLSCRLRPVRIRSEGTPTQDAGILGHRRRVSGTRGCGTCRGARQARQP